MSAAPASADLFRARALAEARRYGSDPWVLVRELLQNARDAGARSVDFRTSLEDGRAILRCRDDGHGLTFEEAQRDLFTLYASRKHGRDAGRFGVGFWSILLLEPVRIVVRSWPRHGEPWEVAWDGALREGLRGAPRPGPPGAEVELDWAASEEPSAAVFAAAWRHARFLRTRDGRAPLAIRVDGRPANAPFELPAPSLAFRRRGLRGVVALGREPRVELFAKGLLVRAGATLEDLLSPGARGADPGTPAALPGLSARFVLDSDDLDLLLSRGDARSDDALLRVMAAAREELDRLVDRQLARAGHRRSSRPRLAAAAALLTAAVGVGAAMARALPSASASLPVSPDAPAVADVGGLRPASASASLPPRPYRDPRRRYATPILDPLDHEPSALALRYEPAAATMHLAVLRVDAFDADGRPRVAREPIAAYEGPRCTDDCVTFELTAAGPSWTSLPLPTGHRLDAASLRVDGRPATAWRTRADEALVRLPAEPARVTYRTGPGAEPARPPQDAPALPDVLRPGARAVGAVPLFERPAAATRWVRSLVRDSRSAEVAARFAEETRRGSDFARTALALGAGDCDVQNGIVARLLQAQGVPARLAVGYLGVDGAPIPGLHAWVEHRAGGESWRVEDASRAATPDPPPPAPRPAPVVAQAAAVPLATSGMLGAGRVAVVATALALVLGAAAALRRRAARTFRLAPTADVVGLVRGALRHPESATRVPALLERALLPRLGGGRATLAESQRLGDDARLYAARIESPLARRARREGGLVLDASRPESRAVADALGAVDLEEWSALLDAVAPSPAAERLNAALDRAGERWRVHAVRGTDAPRVLDLPRTRTVALDAATPWLAAADAEHATHPAAATLALAERMSELLGFSGERQVELLAPLAADALREAAR